jgi:hypothetical protein
MQKHFHLKMQEKSSFVKSLGNSRFGEEHLIAVFRNPPIQ